ncbi:MAG: glycoside hydrolase family 97 N-terminal domain-containing protein, partial [Bacteroidales bacterium]|nr:glycoside hydrolase family 97 N-terminal domain-containing protein [Bacteroidales bacterium]
MLAACAPKQIEFPLSVSSPDGLLTASVGLTADGQPCYKLERNGAVVVKPSMLGFELMAGDSDLHSGFSIAGSENGSADETWEPVWGEERQIRNHYNELLVRLTREDGVNMNLRLRVYDDGL